MTTTAANVIADQNHTSVVQTLAIYICWEKFPSFVLIQTLSETKELDRFPRVTTEINFCWPKLRNDCHGMVFNYLPQYLYKEAAQNWHILCCSFLLRTCGRVLLTISVIN